MQAAVAHVTDTARYAVTMWMIGSDEPAAIQRATTNAEAARIVLWAKADPSIVRIETVDTATGRRTGVWAR